MRPTQRATVIVAVLYALLLTNLLLAPRPLWMFGTSGDAAEVSLNRTLADYIQHSFSYALLTLLLIAAVRPKTVRGLGLCIALSLAHGLGTEALQAIIPRRDCEFSDALANTIGVAAGFVIAAIVFRISTRRSGRSTA